MSLDLKKLKQKKQQDQFIVFGYFRHICNTNNNHNCVPELIVYICLSYYYIFDVFDIKSNELSVSGPFNNIIKRSKCKTFWVSAFGIN